MRLVIGTRLVGISVPYAHPLRNHREKTVAVDIGPSWELGEEGEAGRRGSTAAPTIPRVRNWLISSQPALH